jgi:hypothetical protein
MFTPTESDYVVIPFGRAKTNYKRMKCQKIFFLFSDPNTCIRQQISILAHQHISTSAH